MSTRSTVLRGFCATAVSSVLVLGIAACGSDSVDNSSAEATNSATVPSVSSSASDKSDKKDSKDKNSTSSESASEKKFSGKSEPLPEDGGVEQVDKVPSGAAHSEEDKKFLDALRKKGIDLSKTDAEKSGLEDSVIAAGTSYCRAQEDGQQDTLLPLAAGQLQSLGIVNGDPRETEKVLVDAAKSAYCQ